MSKRRHQTNLTRQGVPDLNHLKGKSRGIRLELPPDMRTQVCEHPIGSVHEVGSDGDTQCALCSQRWDFDGRAY
jgi:hypothetical protein